MNSLLEEYGYSKFEIENRVIECWKKAAKSSREYLVKACHPKTGRRRYYDNCLYFFCMLALSGKYVKY